MAASRHVIWVIIILLLGGPLYLGNIPFRLLFHYASKVIAAILEAYLFQILFYQNLKNYQLCHLYGR